MIKAWKDKIIKWLDYSINEYLYKSGTGIAIGISVSFIQQIKNQDIPATLVTIIISWSVIIIPYMISIAYTRYVDEPYAFSNKKRQQESKYLYDVLPGLFAAISGAFIFNLFAAINKMSVGLFGSIVVGLFLLVVLVLPINIIGFLILESYKKGTEGHYLFILTMQCIVFSIPVWGRIKYEIVQAVSFLMRVF